MPRLSAHRDDGRINSSHIEIRRRTRWCCCKNGTRWRRQGRCLHRRWRHRPWLHHRGPAPQVLCGRLQAVRLCELQRVQVGSKWRRRPSQIVKLVLALGHRCRIRPAGTSQPVNQQQQQPAAAALSRADLQGSCAAAIQIGARGNGKGKRRERIVSFRLPTFSARPVGKFCKYAIPIFN